MLNRDKLLIPFLEPPTYINSTDALLSFSRRSSLFEDDAFRGRACTRNSTWKLSFLEKMRARKNQWVTIDSSRGMERKFVHEKFRDSSTIVVSSRSKKLSSRVKQARPTFPLPIRMLQIDSRLDSSRWTR